MAVHFSQILWGLLLTIFGVELSGFDIFVDGVGYLLIAAGCRGLSSLSPRFETARTLCFVLLVVWLIGFAFEGDTAAVYSLVSAFVDCAMIWQLLGGLRDIAMLGHRPDLAAKAEHHRVAYVWLMVSVSFISLMMRGSGGAELAVMLVLVSMVVLFMILHLIHRFKVELAAKFVPSGPT